MARMGQLIQLVELATVPAVCFFNTIGRLRSDLNFAVAGIPLVRSRQMAFRESEGSGFEAAFSPRSDGIRTAENGSVPSQISSHNRSRGGSQ